MTTSRLDAGDRLLVQRCLACQRWTYPEAARCSACGGELAAEPASGDGTVFTFTVNHHPFHPTLPVPYVIAVVQLAEQEDLRVVGNIVGCAPEDVAVGMPVRAAFERHGDSLRQDFRKR
ncbi:OB-fold domain-containing protein [Frankia sp. AgB1.9]|uniref:Zn-ribbon domain-containing OB-fold protein n=1 Tax=unclassified Frankia TaxID=2632575 RepID=UPI001933884D|nr:MULTISPECIES: OB-fold domain-containing protein [unclassified Frankia]MBL7492038.1 OB-fold domain-containing protein [Frankia sp. AgW1.1]MBL7553309.1 OB-fold domain-containing protein [Frankia sp. AgB1.9]MBL7622486.1 OB-fold domain-containing protein [Frankia sp. AgB1.8]